VEAAARLCDDLRMSALRVALVLAGIALGYLAYQAQVDNLISTTPVRSLATLAYAWAFLAAGLAAWTRRPANRLGPLLIVVGLAMLLRQFRYSQDPLAFTTFFLLGELPYALFVNAVLAYPSGRVTDRLERVFLRVTYAAVIAFPLAILFFYDGTKRLRYFDPRPRESLLLVHGDADVVKALQSTYAVLVYGVIASTFIALIVRRLVQATPRTRRMLTPLLLAAVVAALRAVFDGVLTFAARPPAIVYDNLFWWQVAGLVAVPITLLAGLLRSRLAQGTVADLVVHLERTPPTGIRDELAEALDDQSLDVLFWLPELGEYVDAHGEPAGLPEGDPARAVTRLDHDGEPLAALVHDPSLLEEPELVAAAGAAARLALVNARLHAEVQAQLDQVKESRARIVSAGDEQRRRIERDLHDGAQVRLLALAAELKRTQRGVQDPELEQLLHSTAAGLQSVAREVRDIAHGIHPPLLVQAGLSVALAALADGAPLPVSVSAEPGRFDPEVEVTAYFVASEGLANVAKHAHASRARIDARVVDGTLVVSVEDDGVGGATADGGSGFRGLSDRLEARGGRLTVESPPGAGTRLTGEIPCAS
jgi:signal transduction histidine kinase